MVEDNSILDAEEKVRSRWKNLFKIVGLILVLCLIAFFIPTNSGICASELLHEIPLDSTLVIDKDTFVIKEIDALE